MTITQTVFWKEAPCSLAEARQCLGGSTVLQNVNKFLPDYLFFILSERAEYENTAW
jgi:hypothetical protein